MLAPEQTPRADVKNELRILVVEDEVMIAMYVEDILKQLGCKVANATRVVKALQLIETQQFDGAFLDINVFGAPIHPVVQALSARGIPLAFVTGHARDHIPAEYKNFSILAKPIVEHEFAKAVADFARHAPSDRIHVA